MSQLNWQYGTATDIGASLPRGLREFPQKADFIVSGMRAVGALAMRAALKIYHRLEIKGRENLPADGSLVMVANHSSHLDALCMLAALPLSRLNRAYPAAAEDYFFTSLPRVAAARIFVNALPFSRQHHVRQSIEMCRRLLREPGNILIIFPEGTRSADGKLGEFRPGVGSLVAGLNIPVVPCAIHGAHRALPKGSFIPRPRRLRLTIGNPRCFSESEIEKDSARYISHELRDAVRDLLCN